MPFARRSLGLARRRKQPTGLPDAPSGATAILLESGSYLLLENGARILVDVASTPTLLLGVNLPAIYYGTNSEPITNLYPGDNPQWVGGGYVPLANCDANGWPSSLAAGKTGVWYPFRFPLVSGQVTVTFTPGAVATISAFNATLDASNLAAGTATVTPSQTINGDIQAAWFLAVTFNGGQHVTSMTAVPIGDASVVPATFTSEIQGETISGSPIRVMKMTGVDGTATAATGNLGYTTAFPTSLLTWAKRNTGSYGPTFANDNAVDQVDGAPIETLVAIANALNRDLWDCYQWNVSNDFIDNRAAYVRDNLNPSLKYYAEVSNEVWNFAYSVNAQARAEAQGRLLGADGSGTISNVNAGMNERYCEKTITVMDRISTVWAAVGTAKPTLKRTACFQVVIGGLVAQYLDYAPPSMTALKNHIDVVGGAPYFGTSLPSSTTDQAALEEDGYVNIESIVASTVAFKAQATSRGLGFAAYEGGWSYLIDDATTRNAFETGAATYRLYMYYFARMLDDCGSYPFANFISTLGAYSNSSWGIRKWTGQAATQKSTAATDHLAGRRQPIALTGSFTVAAGSANGTSAGFIGRYCRGASFTFQSGGSGLTINQTTGEVTVSNSGSLPAQGSYTPTIRQTDSRFPAPGYLDTVLPLTVTAALNNTHAYRYYRWIETTVPVNGGTFLREIEIAAVPSGADTTSPGVQTVTASSTAGGGYNAAALIDNVEAGVTSNYWADDFSGALSWVLVDYGATPANWIAANEFRVSGWVADDWPSGWKFQGSDNGTVFTDLIVKTGDTFVAGFRSFTV